MVSLGLPPVRRSILADANEKRPVQVLEDLFQYTLKRADQVAPKKHRFKFTGDVFALNSSTIELCLMLCPWARFHHEKTEKGAVKLHAAIYIANDLPQFVIITDSRQHDMRVAREQMAFKPNDTVLKDKAYVDYTWMNELNVGGVTFVTRAKKTAILKL